MCGNLISSNNKILLSLIKKVWCLCTFLNHSREANEQCCYEPCFYRIGCCYSFLYRTSLTEKTLILVKKENCYNSVKENHPSKIWKGEYLRKLFWFKDPKQNTPDIVPKENTEYLSVFSPNAGKYGPE